MSKSSDYWKKRFELLEQSQLKKGQSYYASLDAQYRLASVNIQKEIDYWYERFAANNNITMPEAKQLLNDKQLREFKWSVEEYIKYGEKNAIDPLWMKQLENASARVHISRLEALKIQTQQQIEVLFGNQIDGIDKLARNIYSEGYYHTAYEIQKGFNIGWDLQGLNEKQIAGVISKPWTVDNKTFTARCWDNKVDLVNVVHTQLTQTIIKGDAPDRAIKTIAERFGVSYRKAGRLVMTESAFFASAAQRDCFNSLDVEQFEVCATLDLRTSEICQDLDGKVIDMKDYAPGSTAPPFHAHCRTTTIPHFDDNFGARIAKNDHGKNYYVPSDVKYPAWKNTFVDGGSKDGWPEVGKVPQLTVADKIQQVKDAISNNNGKIEEQHLHDAGKIIVEELQLNRSDLKSKVDDLQKQYEESGIKDINDQIEKMRTGKSTAIGMYKLGLKNMNEWQIKWNELLLKKSELVRSNADLENNLREAKLKYKGTMTDNAQELKDTLSQIRNMGNSSFDVDGHLENSRSPMRKVVKNAYDHYPTEWVEKSVTGGKLTPKKVDRGYYRHYSQEIGISGHSGDHSDFETAIHELGHRFERVVPEIKQTEKVFYDRRTAGEQSKWLGGGYKKEEKAKFDKFLVPYIGKDYGGQAYELVSMGFEYAYTNPTRLWEDEDYAKWIYGILALL